jgi:hypothetical protein
MRVLSALWFAFFPLRRPHRTASPSSSSSPLILPPKIAATPLEAQRALLRMAEVTRMISLMIRDRGSIAHIGLREEETFVNVRAEVSMLPVDVVNWKGVA